MADKLSATTARVYHNHHCCFYCCCCRCSQTDLGREISKVTLGVYCCLPVSISERCKYCILKWKHTNTVGTGVCCRLSRGFKSKASWDEHIAGAHAETITVSSQRPFLPPPPPPGEPRLQVALFAQLGKFPTLTVRSADLGYRIRGIVREGPRPSFPAFLLQCECKRSGVFLVAASKQEALKLLIFLTPLPPLGWPWPIEKNSIFLKYQTRNNHSLQLTNEDHALKFRKQKKQEKFRKTATPLS